MQPPETDPSTRPSSRMARSAPSGRGELPQVRTTVTSSTRRFAASHSVLRLSTSRSTLSMAGRKRWQDRQYYCAPGRRYAMVIAGAPPRGRRTPTGGARAIAGVAPALCTPPCQASRAATAMHRDRPARWRVRLPPAPSPRSSSSLPSPSRPRRVRRAAGSCRRCSSAAARCAIAPASAPCRR